MFFFSSLFFSVKFQRRWNVINLWPLKNNALLCGDGTIPVLPTPVSFCSGLLLNLFITVSNVSTQHSPGVILSAGWLMLLLSLPLFVKLISLYLAMLLLIGSVGIWTQLCVDVSAKSVTHWPSLITCPGNFWVLWACDVHRESTLVSTGKHVSHMWWWARDTEGVTDLLTYNIWIEFPQFPVHMCICVLLSSTR